MGDPNYLQSILQTMFRGSGPTILPATQAYGAFASNTDSPQQEESSEKVERGLADIKAILPSLPEAEAYYMAKSQINERAEDEAAPIKFLRASKYDPSAAAQRLARYWSVRREIFKDRWLEPMVQTGEGALKRSELTLLYSAFCIFLPNDYQGHCCLFIDPSKLGKSGRDTHQRCMFYLYSLAAENIKSQQAGIMLFYPMDKKSRPDSIREDAAMHLLQALPVRLKRLHLLGYPPTPENSIHLQLNEAVVRQDIGSHIEPHRILFHRAVTEDNLLNALEAYGFSRRDLPELIGGTWELSNFTRFCEEQTRREWGLPAARGGNRDEIPEIGQPKPKAKSLSELNEEEKVERKRKMNTLHSRRKRERKRNEINELQQNVSELQADNLQLYHKNKALEDLISKANSIVESYEKTGVIPKSSSDSTVSNASFPKISLPSTPGPAQQDDTVSSQAMNLAQGFAGLFNANFAQPGQQGSTAPSASHQPQQGFDLNSIALSTPSFPLQGFHVLQQAQTPSLQGISPELVRLLTGSIKTMSAPTPPTASMPPSQNYMGGQHPPHASQAQSTDNSALLQALIHNPAALQAIMSNPQLLASLLGNQDGHR